MKRNWYKQTVLFLSGQAITMFGSAIVQFGISWHITLSTKSGTMLTLATIFGFLPQVIVSMFGGVWADRFDRKKLIILADGLIASFTAILAILFSIGHTEIWLLFVISAVRSIGAGIQTPAVGAFLPEIVPEEKLMKVNGLNASIMGANMILAPAAAGGLYEYLGLGMVFWVDVITAAIGIFMLITLKTEKRPVSGHEPEHFLKDMMTGVKYVTKTQWLLIFFGFYVLYSLMFGPIVFLTPLMVARSFGDEKWRLVVHEIVFSAGTIIGGLVIGMISKHIKNKMILLISACVAFGLTTFIMGFSPNFIFYLAVMLPMGISMPFINTSTMTILQVQVEQKYIGRVFGLISVVSSGMMPLSMAIFGPLADRMRIESQLIITGVFMVMISFCMFISKQTLAKGVLPEQTDEPATLQE